MEVFMTRKEQIQFLIHSLLEEMPEYRSQAAMFSKEDTSQRQLLRSLMNVRPPMPLSPDFLAVESELLSSEAQEKGIIDVLSLPGSPFDPKLSLWQGDITRLKADAIVNAANNALLGCFIPCHGCIDNAIHSAAGLELRNECQEIMKVQGHPEETGKAKLTKGYHLPAKFVLHTVGPIIYRQVTEKDRKLLESCYRSCLETAASHHLESVAFCCISTGEFRFPNDLAAQIAVTTVEEFLRSENTSIRKVVFNVFKDFDKEIYSNLLGIH